MNTQTGIPEITCPVCNHNMDGTDNLYLNEVMVSEMMTQLSKDPCIVIDCPNIPDIRDEAIHQLHD